MHLTYTGHWRVLFTSWEQGTCTNVDHLSLSHRLYTVVSSLASSTFRLPTNHLHLTSRQMTCVANGTVNELWEREHKCQANIRQLQPRTNVCQIKQSVTDTDLAARTVCSCQRINQLHQSLRCGLTQSVEGGQSIVRVSSLLLIFVLLLEAL